MNSSKERTRSAENADKIRKDNDINDDEVQEKNDIKQDDKQDKDGDKKTAEIQKLIYEKRKQTDMEQSELDVVAVETVNLQTVEMIENVVTNIINVKQSEEIKQNILTSRTDINYFISVDTTDKLISKSESLYWKVIDNRIPSLFAIKSTFDNDYNSAFDVQSDNFADLAIKNESIKGGHELTKTGTKLLFYESVPDPDLTVKPLITHVDVSQFRIVFDGVDRTQMIQFSFKIAQLQNFLSVIASPNLLINIPSQTLIAANAQLDNNVARTYKGVQIPSINNQHPVFGAFTINYQHIINMMNIQFDPNNSRLFPLFTTVKKRQIAGILMEKWIRLCLDQYAAALINLSYYMLTNNRITNTQFLRYTQACASYNVIMTIPSGVIEEERLNYNPNKEDWKCALLMTLLSTDKIDELILQIKYAIHDRGLFLGSASSILVNPNFMSKSNTITNFISSFLLKTASISTDEHIRLQALEMFVDFIDVKVEYQLTTDVVYVAWDLLNILGLALIYPKIFWQGLASVYNHFVNVCTVVLPLEFMKYCQLGQFVRRENNRWVRANDVQFYNDNMHWKGVYPRIFVQTVYTRDEQKRFPILSRVGKLIEPKYVPYQLNLKTMAGYPFIGRNNTFYLSHNPISIRDIKELNLNSVDIIFKYVELLDIIYSASLTVGAVQGSAMKSEMANILTALRNNGQSLVHYTNLLMGPIQRSIVNSFPVMIDRTIPHEYYRFRSRFSINNSDLEGNSKYTKLLDRPILTIRADIFTHVLLCLQTIFPRPMNDLFQDLSSDSYRNDVSNITVKPQPAAILAFNSLYYAYQAKKDAEALFIAIVSGNPDYRGVNPMSDQYLEFMRQFLTKNNIRLVYNLISETFKIDIQSLFTNVHGFSIDPTIKDISLFETYDTLLSHNEYGFSLLGVPFVLCDDYFLEKAKLVAKLCLVDNSPLYQVETGVYLMMQETSEISYNTNFIVPENIPVITYINGINYFSVQYSNGIARDLVYKFAINGQSYVLFTVATPVPLHMLVINNLGDVPAIARDMLIELVKLGRIYIHLPNLQFTYEIIFTRDRNFSTGAEYITQILKEDVIRDKFHFIFYDTSLSFIKSINDPAHTRFITYLMPENELEYKVVGGGFFNENLSDKLIPLDQNVLSPGEEDEDNILISYMPKNTTRNKLDAGIPNLVNRVVTINQIRFFGIGDIESSYVSQI